MRNWQAESRKIKSISFTPKDQDYLRRKLRMRDHRLSLYEFLMTKTVYRVVKKLTKPCDILSDYWKWRSEIDKFFKL